MKSSGCTDRHMQWTQSTANPRALAVLRVSNVTEFSCQHEALCYQLSIGLELHNQKNDNELAWKICYAIENNKDASAEHVGDLGGEVLAYFVQMRLSVWFLAPHKEKEPLKTSV